MFGTTSDVELRLAFGIGLAALVAGLGLALQVMAMRVRNQRRVRERSAVHARWRPLLAQAALGDDPREVLPPLTHRELDDVLLLWNQMQDGLRGSAHECLNRAAAWLGLHGEAQRWSESRAIARRVLGLATLGHIGRNEDLPRLRTALVDPQGLVSLTAARALLQIDAVAAVPEVLDQYLARSDWPAARLGTLLRDAGADAVAPPLIERLLRVGGDAQLQLLRLLRFAESPRTGGVLEALVERSDDPQVLSVALRQLHGPAALGRVRELARFPDALVRSAAAVALGRIGGESDRELLVELMSDRDWWVRYRATQAQLDLPRSDAAAIAALRERLGDRYAVDMLDHVLGERALLSGDAPGPAATAAAAPPSTVLQP